MMFASVVPKPFTDRQAQPPSAASRQTQQRGLINPVSIRNILIEKNTTANGRPSMRWRRLRPAALKEVGRNVLLRKNSSNLTATSASASSSSSSLQKMASTQKLLPQDDANPLWFLQERCPEDVLPLILAFVGPQKAAMLQRTNRHWRNILNEEVTWKVMSQELYKVRAYIAYL